jgi:hypothetical protein
MLMKFRRGNVDDASIEARYRHGKPQSDTLARYLSVVRRHSNPAVEAGFNAVLTDFLAHAFSGGVVEPEFYMGLDDAEIEREFTAEEDGCGAEHEIPTTPITRKHLTLVHSRP